MFVEHDSYIGVSPEDDEQVAGVEVGVWAKGPPAGAAVSAFPTSGRPDDDLAQLSTLDEVTLLDTLERRYNHK